MSLSTYFIASLNFTQRKIEHGSETNFYLKIKIKQLLFDSI